MKEILQRKWGPVDFVNKKARGKALFKAKLPTFSSFALAAGYP